MRLEGRYGVAHRRQVVPTIINRLDVGLHPCRVVDEPLGYLSRRTDLGMDCAIRPAQIVQGPSRYTIRKLALVFAPAGDGAFFGDPRRKQEVGAVSARDRFEKFRDDRAIRERVLL